MEQDQNPSLFSLSVDSQSKSFLQETAKWGSFLAIAGFIACALLIIAGIVMATTMTGSSETFKQFGGRSSGMEGLGVMMAGMYILLAILYFFPCLYLLRFSSHMKAALASDDQANLTVAFQNLKSMFKFVGILTILIIALYVVAFIIGIGSKV